MDQSKLPRHVVDRFERRWAQQLEKQAHAWKDARADARSVTDSGVPVVRRGKRVRLPERRPGLAS
jgi:hypothetical protein